jgi:hypothetical protein
MNINCDSVAGMLVKKAGEGSVLLTVHKRLFKVYRICIISSAAASSPAAAAAAAAALPAAAELLLKLRLRLQLLSLLSNLMLQLRQLLPRLQPMRWRLQSPLHVIRLTGLSGSGKTTTGRVLEKYFRELRRTISSELGFSKDVRETHARRVAYLSQLLSRNGIITIVTLISPYRGF